VKVAEIVNRHHLTASPADSASHAWASTKAEGTAYIVALHDDEVVGVVARSDLGGPSGGAHRRMGRRIGTSSWAS
jgi:CBS domain-containing protein